ncbi:MAG: DUF6858 family protein [Candidatus Thiodiazotropha sp. 6PLUC2]
MQQVVEEIGLPVFSLQIDKADCRFKSVEEIVAYFESEIAGHKSARFIATFNHLKHTSELPEGQLAEGIIAAYNVLFCFGFTLQAPEQLACRPRSIGICQMEDQITVSFIEAPMPVANAVMEKWANSLMIEHPASTSSPMRPEAKKILS